MSRWEIDLRHDRKLLDSDRRYLDIRIAIESWLSAVEEADLAGVVMLHSERGAMDVFDVVRSNVHDSHHHCWDLTRILRRH
jgi:hypothetical protein